MENKSRQGRISVFQAIDPKGERSKSLPSEFSTKTLLRDRKKTNSVEKQLSLRVRKIKASDFTIDFKPDTEKKILPQVERIEEGSSKSPLPHTVGKYERS